MVARWSFYNGKPSTLPRPIRLADVGRSAARMRAVWWFSPMKRLRDVTRVTFLCGWYDQLWVDLANGNHRTVVVGS